MQNLPAQVIKHLQSAGASAPYRVTPLAGDASSRTYKRISDAKQASWILMEFTAGPQSLAEEKTPGAVQSIHELPFVNVARFLARNAVQVPRIFGVGDGHILLEDLGDLTLYDWLQTKPPRRAVVNYYRLAIEQLARIHQAKEQPDDPCIASTRRFDAALYLWEFEHFIEYGIQWLLHSNKRLPKLHNYFAALSQQLASFAVCINHRDYHSKNLMLRTQPQGSHSIWVLDFQDAILAPPHYDLASLIFDSYVELSDDEVSELSNYYMEIAPQSLHGSSPETFEQELRIVALQRNLKAAGRFVYILAVKKKMTHMPYYIPTMRKVQRHLEVLGADADFRAELPFEGLEKAATLLAEQGYPIGD